MAKTWAPDLWEILYGITTSERNWTSADQKNSIARALEDLLNTRQALPNELIKDLPSLNTSLLTYGLMDFSALCIASEKDRGEICAAVTQAILRHEPRLTDVRAKLHPETTSINRLGFIIQARIKDAADGTTVHFGGILEPAAQRYTIRPMGT